LVFEYEEILKRNVASLGLSLDAVEQLLNAICARGKEYRLSHGWAPVLGDPDDEPLVQLAVESGAYCVVTHNVRDLTPAIRLGVEVITPSAFLQKLQEQK
jgi:predicted nucleic acid-binding protein